MTYRVLRHKPILFFSVTDAEFLERSASGGRAQHCLVVAIKAGRLVIRPFFPFNLLFLPELYGLEIDVPLDNVVWAEILPRRRGSWGRLVEAGGRTVLLRIRQPGQGARSFEVLLTKADAFVKLLPPSAQAGA